MFEWDRIALRGCPSTWFSCRPIGRLIEVAPAFEKGQTRVYGCNSFGMGLKRILVQRNEANLPPSHRLDWSQKVAKVYSSLDNLL